MVDTITPSLINTFFKYNDKDVIAGGMFIHVMQWVFPSTDADIMNKNSLFTEKQYRKMGSLLRTDPAYANLYNEITKDVNPEFSPTALAEIFNHVFNIGIRARIEKEFKTYITAGTPMPLSKAFTNYIAFASWGTAETWRVVTLIEIEKLFDKGRDFTDIIGEFYDFCQDEYPEEYRGLVVESNNLLLVLNPSGVWEIRSSIGWDHTDYVDEDYAATLDTTALESVYYPSSVVSKNPFNATEFPILGYNNVFDTMFVSGIGAWDNKVAYGTGNSDVVNLDPLSVLGAADARVLSIVGLDVGGVKKHYIHSRYWTGSEFLDKITDYDIVSQNVNNSVSDACTIVGVVFSIDRINPTNTSLLDTGFGHLLLITGAFTLTETSTSDVYTNFAIWNPDTNSFLPYVLGGTIPLSYYATLLFNETPIFKTDSQSFDYAVPNDTSDTIVDTYVAVGISKKNDDYNVVPYEVPPFYTLKCAYKDDGLGVGLIEITGKDDYVELFGEYNAGMTSYVVQKFGYAIDGLNKAEDSTEFMIYTGKGIFFVDFINNTISDKSNVNPRLRSRISATALSGETANIQQWRHPDGINESLTEDGLDGSMEFVTGINFNNSFPRYHSVDDTKFKNFNTHSAIDAVGNSNAYYLQRPRVLVASGWSRLGNLSNVPALYNNWEVDGEASILMEANGGTMVDLLHLISSTSKVNFPKQTKVILMKTENSLHFNSEFNDTFGVGREDWVPGPSKFFYSFKEVELPIGYGNKVRNAFIFADVELPMPG